MLPYGAACIGALVVTPAPKRQHPMPILSFALQHVYMYMVAMPMCTHAMLNKGDD